MRKIRLAIIGLGDISKTHIKAIEKTAGAELVAVCSRSSEKVKQKAGKLGVKGYTDIDEMLKDAGIDGVVILTPPNTHTEIGIKAAQAGKHVMVEKPIDIDGEKARKLIGVCKENKVKLAVISQMRFGRAVTKVKKLIREGKFGQLLLIRASMEWSRSQEYYRSKAWRMDAGEGGVLINQAIHFLDLIRWLGGEYKDTCLFKEARLNLPVEDTVVGVIKFKNGALGILEATTAACRNLPNILGIHGTKGSIVIKNNRIIEYHFGPYSLINTIKSRLKSKLISLVPLRKGHHSDQIKNFVEAIKNKEPVFVDGEEGYKTLELCRKMYQNAR